LTMDEGFLIDLFMAAILAAGSAFVVLQVTT
jgi:hypothetical protein